MTSTPTPAQAPEPTTGERLTWMRQNSKRLIIALVLLLVAAAVVTFSFSLFTSSSASPGNLVTSGSMAIDSDKDGVAIFTAEGLLPGESGAGTVKITNVGESDGDFTLTASNLVDTPATPAYSGQLTLVITDEAATQVYTGPLASMTTASLGTWAPDETHTYTFTVTFASAAGNEYQNAQTTLDFTFTAGQA